MNLQAPVSYQGSKSKLANRIVSLIDPDRNKMFVDLCCGSGAIALEVINQGHDPCKVLMVDSGPWGTFWQSIADNSFDVDRFETMIANIDDIGEYVYQLSRESIIDEDVPYTFLILQAASFGSKAIDIVDGTWKRKCFKTYLSPNGPEIVSRVGRIKDQLGGRIWAGCCKIESLSPIACATVYIDPPYTALEGYGGRSPTMSGNHIDWSCLLKFTGSTVFISESRRLSEVAWRLSTSGSSINAEADSYEEWLSKLW